ncbi:MAG TPA: hypothetical protein ENI22_00860 [Candidatus Pacearchaeota archaeon]|nr:hypothetical protein [Candidatus Pacearchaeota archaeon]
MADIINIIIGILVLFLGIPIGNYLAKFTRDELKLGQGWFKLIIIFSLIGALIGLLMGDDVLFFSFLFITIVTGRSLKR